MDRDSSIEIAAKKAILPFKIVEHLGVPCGYERSFKMFQNTLLANRYLLGINTKDVNRESLLHICRQLGMPKSYLDSFESSLADANLVFLGFEHNEDDCVYKIYLEFWEKVQKDLQMTPGNTSPVLLHLGFKWKTTDNSQGTISK
jgi:hypothetical protein